MRHLSTIALAAITMMLSYPLACYGAAKTSQQVATESLAAQNISVDNANFIKQIAAGNIENVNLFIAAGAGAGSQDESGTSALMASLTLPSDDITQLLLSTLPQDGKTILDLKDKDGSTALHKAIELGKFSMAEILIARSASVSISNNAHTTPLMLAVRKKNESLVATILAADKASNPPYALVPQEDSRGNTALIYAIESKSSSITQMLLEAGASPTSSDSLGFTPLMAAAKSGEKAIVEMLLGTSADINASNKSDDTALTIALKANNTDIAQLLLSKIPDASANFVPALTAALEAKAPDEQLFLQVLARVPQSEKLPPALLFKAIDSKNSAIASALIARTPEVNIRNENNETLFYHALDAGFEDIVLELVKRGADITQPGVSGSSAIARAVRHNMAKVVSMLLDKGTSADQKTPEGYTLAEMCVYSGYPETLEVLISKGVKLEKEFALLWAIRDGKGKAAPVLLAHGAVPNIMNQDGTPAITLAAEAGQVEAVQAFIKYKATIDYPSKTRGITALGAAASSGHLEIVKALVEAGANIEAADNAGMTPLAHAASLSRLQVVEYLISKGANIRAIDAQKRSISDIAALAPAATDREKVLQALAAAHKQR